MRWWLKGEVEGGGKLPFKGELIPGRNLKPPERGLEGPGRGL